MTKNKLFEAVLNEILDPKIEIVDGSIVPQTWYHGTGEDVSKVSIQKYSQTKDMDYKFGMLYLSKNPKVALSYGPYLHELTIKSTKAGMIDFNGDWWGNITSSKQRIVSVHQRADDWLDENNLNTRNGGQFHSNPIRELIFKMIKPLYSIDGKTYNSEKAAKAAYIKALDTTKDLRNQNPKVYDQYYEYLLSHSSFSSSDWQEPTENLAQQAKRKGCDCLWVKNVNDSSFNGMFADEYVGYAKNAKAVEDVVTDDLILLNNDLILSDKIIKVLKSKWD